MAPAVPPTLPPGTENLPEFMKDQLRKQHDSKLPTYSFPPGPPHRPLWPAGAIFDLSIHLTTTKDWTIKDSRALWSARGLSYSDKQPLVPANFALSPSSPMMSAAWANATVYAHVFAALQGATIDDADPQDCFIHSTCYLHLS